MPAEQVPEIGKLPELLAPAGSPAAFRAAVAAGADAVYLSGKRFGARKFAANFSDGEIEEAITFAHERGVRVYVTVNTLLHDRELPGAVEYLLWLWSVGVDALLVQDTGLIRLAREVVPGLVLHASTQMTIHNSAGVSWAAEEGLSRVVLARELSLEEVNQIAAETEETGVGLEVFAHGALCYCYSGQCLLSSVIGGRSGNRGICAQPCRKPYTLVTGTIDEYGRPVTVKEHALPGPYLLSPMDLCTYRHLPELVSSPVASLKIEGRMKSPEYVALVVSTYRKALDSIAAGPWAPDPRAERELLLAFNRGFTSGYLLGKRYGSVMGRDAPDNRGLCIGTVTGYDNGRRTVTVRLGGPVIPETGDGLWIAGGGDDPSGIGFLLNNTPARTGKDAIVFAIPEKVRAGSKVYMTFSRKLDLHARQIIGHPPAGMQRPVPVDLSVTVDGNGTLAIGGVILPGTRNLQARWRAENIFSPARSRPLFRDELRQQLVKTGGTPFAVRNIRIEYNENLSAPLALLNNARREFFRHAGEMLVSASRPAAPEVSEARQRWDARCSAPFSEKPKEGKRKSQKSLRILLCTDTIEGVRRASDAGCDEVWFEPGFQGTCRPPGTIRQSINREEILAACAICRKTGIEFKWKVPKIAHDRELNDILDILSTCVSEGMTGCCIENMGTASALIKRFPSINLSGFTGLNIFNHVAAGACTDRFCLLTISSELSRDEMEILIREARSSGSRCTFALVVEALAEAGVTEDCPARPVRHCRDLPKGDPGDFYGIRDSRGRVFPVTRDASCRTHILNAVETCLIDSLPGIARMGIGGIVIDARGRPPAYVKAMTGIYREAVDSCGQQPEGARADLSKLKERIKTLAWGGLTAGSFFRGLREEQ
ncbi:MAG: U32 family peptidase [Methanoregula sp.]|nr:U32 family peptidase [Methanoregula sp.]